MLRETGSVYGVYRIVRLTGYTEKSAEGDLVGVTYVDLDCVSGPGPASTLARIPGGPLPDGTIVPGAVDLRRDEVLGLVLQPISDSRAAYTFGPSEVFRRLDAQSYGNLHLRLTGSVDAFAAEAKKLDSVACDAPATPVAALPNLAGLPPSSPTSWTLPKPVFHSTEPAGKTHYGSTRKRSISSQQKLSERHSAFPSGQTRPRPFPSGSTHWQDNEIRTLFESRRYHSVARLVGCSLCECTSGVQD